MNVKEPLLSGLRGACHIFLADLRALPEEAYGKSFGPASRTVADIVYEVNMVNDHVGMALRGEEPFAWPDGGYIRAPEDFKEKSVVLAAFKESKARLLATIEGMSEADFETTVETERGPKTGFERCQFMTVHMWYHSGQLNYIQTLIGDDGWHWG
jgi:DinB superfamily